MENINILVVCHGNVCRSPLAAAELAYHMGWNNVRSRGTHAKNRQRASLKVREYAYQVGLNIDRHRSQKLDQIDVDWATIILYMDYRNYKNLQSFQAAQEKCINAGNLLGQSKIQDPGFISRGPRLEAILAQVSTAAVELLDIMTKKAPDCLPGLTLIQQDVRNKEIAKLIKVLCQPKLREQDQNQPYCLSKPSGL